MKKLLIIQLDEAYFLYETLLMLERHRDALKDLDLTILADEAAFAQVEDGSLPIFVKVKTKIDDVLFGEFDTTVNLSLEETSWTIHNHIKAPHKLGPCLRDNELRVADLWSTYLLTHKGKAPFLSFHLQDIYKNVLGIKKLTPVRRRMKSFQTLVYGLANPDFFPAAEQEKLLGLIQSHFPETSIKDISEVDPVSDLTKVLYLGPATFEALKICESGATGIFFGSTFKGFNLLPHGEGHYYVSTRNSKATAQHLFQVLLLQMVEKSIPSDFPYALYQIDEGHLFGSYLRSLNSSDETYPVYQSQVVLWNFVLNLFDTNLEVTRCTETQISLLLSQVEVLKKLNRLYDYAMASIDGIYQQAKSRDADAATIKEQLKVLLEIESLTNQIAQSHPLLRPVLDFYRIRRGQSLGRNLLEQSQDCLLLYSEEHQTLRALLELFTVTLNKNEVTI